MRVISYTSLPLLFYFMHGLDANTTYQLAVAAVTSIGAGPEAVVMVKTLEDGESVQSLAELVPSYLCNISYRHRL